MKKTLASPVLKGCQRTVGNQFYDITTTLTCTALEAMLSTLWWSSRLRHPCFVNICRVDMYCVYSGLIETHECHASGWNHTSHSGMADSYCWSLVNLENKLDPCPYVLAKHEGLVCTVCHSSPSLVFQLTRQTKNEYFIVQGERERERE